MKYLMLVVLTISPILGQTENSETAESQIRELFAAMTQAWEQGDGAAWGASFVPDADFTVWFGLQLEGREEISKGHQFIFDNFYKETSYQLAVRKLRFLTPELAVVHLTGSVVKKGEALPDEPDSVPLAVVEREESGWKVLAFHNTAFAIEKYGRNGDIRAFKGR